MWLLWALLSLVFAPPAHAIRSFNSSGVVCDFTDLLEPFVDALEVPAAAVPASRTDSNYFELEITEESGFKLHRDLPTNTMWVYNKQYPGPTFTVNRKQKIQVKITNNLPINRALNPMLDFGSSNPPDRTVVHLHGGINKPQFCGHPLDFVRPYNGSNSYTNFYPNNQPAGHLWYHDHTLGLTVPNVYSGLTGNYFVNDNFEKSMKLPQGDFSIPLTISSRDFNRTTGQMYIPSDRSLFIPKYNMVNNKVWPYLNVSQNRYRFRLLNAATHRMFVLYFDPPLNFTVIGSDGEFLPQPVVHNEIILGSGERYDIIIDFEKTAVGTTFTMLNKALDPYSNGPGFAPGQPLICPAKFVMQFRVARPYNKTVGKFRNIPTEGLVDNDSLTESQINTLRVRNFTLSLPAIPKFLIDGKPFLSRLNPYVTLGSSEVWEFYNAHPTVAHAIHTHQMAFKLLSRQNATIRNPFISLNSSPYSPQHPTLPQFINITGPRVAPLDYELGKKDTILVYPMSITRVLMQEFGPYPGEFVWHCHTLDHEENDMMQRWAITPTDPGCGKGWGSDEWDC